MPRRFGRGRSDDEERAVVEHATFCQRESHMTAYRRHGPQKHRLCARGLALWGRPLDLQKFSSWSDAAVDPESISLSRRRDADDYHAYLAYKRRRLIRARYWERMPLPGPIEDRSCRSATAAFQAKSPKTPRQVGIGVQQHSSLRTRLDRGGHFAGRVSTGILVQGMRDCLQKMRLNAHRLKDHYDRTVGLRMAYEILHAHNPVFAQVTRQGVESVDRTDATTGQPTQSSIVDYLIRSVHNGGRCGSNAN